MLLDAPESCFRAKKEPEKLLNSAMGLCISGPKWDMNRRMNMVFFWMTNRYISVTRESFIQYICFLCKDVCICRFFMGRIMLTVHAFYLQRLWAGEDGILSGLSSNSSQRRSPTSLNPLTSLSSSLALAFPSRFFRPALLAVWFPNMSLKLFCPFSLSLASFFFSFSNFLSY